MTSQAIEEPRGRRAEIAFGIRLSLPAGLGMFPLGVAFGILVIQYGLPWWMAPALSIAVYAGSVELLLVGLIAAATPLATIALTTLLVNFRHVFYAFTFPLHVVRNPLARAYSVYALTDESYAITAANPRGWTSPRLLATQLAFQCYWVFGGLAGVLFASALPGTVEGLEFALVALFITLTLDACRTRKQVPSLVMALGCFAAAHILLPEQSLFVAMMLFVVALAVRYALSRQAGQDGQEVTDA
ncbi:AzlC family ABC transporter permease [Citricoccus sp. I39-566]|uniref:AzlC family ABC transporter permease n=1 Tax=Citricoccus sp. I39-566 TaxID=3073268 RepID=UPI00286AEEC4|nr:AzlC family ABC transporter permease [Citricoccus sp. I39-566]WMY78787.1 AzlC family ABC transporter permease [Citricoccus sp. I39-566]